MPKKFTKNKFIEKAKEAHGNKYDYSKVEYVNSQTKVCIICPKHGEFWQRPSDHMRGVGCRKCYGNQKMTKDEFIKKSRKIHGDKYDYSKVDINGNNKIKVCIICPIHGEFWQRPNDHLMGYGCPYCAGNAKKSTEKFIEEALLVHGYKYDYSKVEYNGARKKVCIICPKHGEFWQEPHNHLQGSSCPYCNCGNKSKMEWGIREELEKSNIEFEHQKTFDWLKYKKNLFLDFYVEKYKLAIEVQGDQHFLPIKRYGGEEDFIVRQKRDAIKKKLCEKHGIKIFYITKKNYTLNEVYKYINETTN